MNLTSVDQYTVGSTVRLHGTADDTAIYVVARVSDETVWLDWLCGSVRMPGKTWSFNPEAASDWLTASVVSIDGNPGLKARRQARKVKP